MGRAPSRFLSIAAGCLVVGVPRLEQGSIAPNEAVAPAAVAPFVGVAGKSLRTIRISRVIGVLFLLFGGIALQAQAPTGTKRLEFEAASVKPVDANSPPFAGNTSFDMGPGGEEMPVGDSFSMRSKILIVLRFAYRITPLQEQSARSQLPDWALSDRFDIEARAAGNVTKEQMRLMVQSLLEDRFHLKAHIETRRGAVLSLELVKPTTLGAHLRPHQMDTLCPTDAGTNENPVPPDGLPKTCGRVFDNLVHPGGSAAPLEYAAARNVSLLQIIERMTLWTNRNLPIVNATGLTGTFDFNLEFFDDMGGCVASAGGICTQRMSDTEMRPDQSGPGLAQALRDQLGLKLIPTKGPVEFFVVEHLERPTAN